MNKTAIRNFAIWARNRLIADIKYRAGLMGITENGIASAMSQSTANSEFYDIGTANPYAISGEEIRQRKALVAAIQKKERDSDYKIAYKYIIEEVAYTWFNRLIAVRFMEVNDYLPSHVRVLSSESGKMEPDLVTNPFEAGLDFSNTEEEMIIALKRDNKLDEVFKILFIKQCNTLNAVLPLLFEKTSDYTELLLNLSVIDQDGVIYHLVHDIPEEDFNISEGGQVEIIGWMYQYYNTEPKDETFALLKKNVKITKERIPSATQLFTPDWIVRYMVENSLGRLWLEGHPNEELKSGWTYYLEEAEQEPDVKAQLEQIRSEYKSLNPEDIKVIDPCMGSGHILVYCFDVLMQIYKAQGYSGRDAAQSILEHNIYGLDIDDRAAQLAYFAVMMKARQYDRRIFTREIKSHIYAIQESNNVNRRQLSCFGVSMSEIEKNAALSEISGLLDTLKDAKEYGSILNVDNYNWELLRRFAEKADAEGQLSLDSIGWVETQKQLIQLIEVGQTLAQEYDVVVTNPPYRGMTDCGKKLNDYVLSEWPNSKSDLYAVFIEKCHLFAKVTGFIGMITMQSWMYLASFKNLRKEVLTKYQLINMLVLGSNAFDSGDVGTVVQTSTFVSNASKIVGYSTTFSELSEPKTPDGKRKLFLSNHINYSINQDNFLATANCQFMYDASEIMLSHLKKRQPFSYYAVAKPGMQTSDNDRFLRLWNEIEFSRIGFDLTHEAAKNSLFKWFPYNKGVGYRKWYGNNDYVVNFQNDGEELKFWLTHNPKDPSTTSWSRNLRNYQYYFQEGITFTAIGLAFSARLNGNGYLFDTKGPTMFGSNLTYLCGFVNSIVFDAYNRALCKQMTKSADSVNMVPVIIEQEKNIEEIVNQTVVFSKTDWDSFETSWDFQRHPLVALAHKTTYKTNGVPAYRIADVFDWWNNECDTRFAQLKANEEELNRIFIDIYGLQDELTPEVEDKDVTVRKADLQRDIKSLLSYAVGCMFGRYSLDADGLAYAGGEWDDSKYTTFLPDEDNVIPITDEEYLEDDIVGLLCAWLKKVYGTNMLEENLDFIAAALGNKGSTSREIIRNYFLNDFMKDHIKIYQKRPIYWLFDSGKQNGFKALVYMHRYNADTIGNVRVEYLHRMQRIYESEIGRMQDTIDNSKNNREVALATKRKEKLQKQLKECREYDEKIGHLALARTEIDLDDGVKVNYRKVQTAADGKFYEILADSKNIMAKEK